MISISGRLLAVGVLLVAGSGLSGCGLFNGSSHLEEALEYLPADATDVTFTDRAATIERLGLDDIDGDPTEEQTDEFLKAIIEDRSTLTQIDSYTQVMAGEAAFSGHDVEWEATANADDQRLVVWKLDDEVDFDKLADDLEDAGFDRAGDDDQPTFTADIAAADDNGLIGGRYPADMLNTALVPDERLVITGDIDTGVDVATDDTDSLADKGSFDDLLDKAPGQDGLEFAALTIEPRCDGGAGGRVTPEQLEALKAQAGSLGRPDGIALYVNPDERVTVARLFGSDDDAESEADGLADFLEESGQRSGLEVDFDVEQDGAAVLVEADSDDRRNVIAAWQRVDGPFQCLPE